MFQFKITLRNISAPKVWRRVIVPENFSFHKFHLVIQESFGWYNSHLHEFSPFGLGSFPAIGIPEFSDDEIADDKKVKLDEIFYFPKCEFTYVYDFGDDWEHDILLERITKDNENFATCINGKGACPPEDCGGYSGYVDLKKIMKNPKNPEFEETRVWLGVAKNKTWDKDKFDIEKVNRRIRRIS